jgi:hypothetical protein
MKHAISITLLCSALLMIAVGDASAAHRTRLVGRDYGTPAYQERSVPTLGGEACTIYSCPGTSVPGTARNPEGAIRYPHGE